ncbi:hypothetical protein ACJ41O_004791 [Fusarium nematophilum]
MDFEVTWRTPSPIPSLSHDSPNTPAGEQVTTPSFSSNLAQPSLIKGSEEARILSILDQADAMSLAPGLASPASSQNRVCGISELNLPAGLSGSRGLDGFNAIPRGMRAIPDSTSSAAEPHRLPPITDRKPHFPPVAGTPDFLLIYCFDVERAAGFYSRCFDWKFYGDVNAREFDDLSKRQWGTSLFDEQPMNFFNSSDEQDGQLNITGALIKISTWDVRARFEQKRKLARSCDATPICHIRVPDLGDVEDLIEVNGGEIKHLRYGIRQCIMDVGEFIDPEGNLVGLISLHPENATAVPNEP